MVYIWLSIAVSFLIFEVGHPGLFFFLSFSCGAVCAAILSYSEFELMWQITGFLVSAVCSLLAMRALFVGHVHGATHTNVYALQGKQAVVTSAIPAHGVGQVKVGGEEWSAESLHDEAYAVGTRVTIKRVQGARVIVERA
jgi:membrane protein implicated in regulation of membrane protease activity